MESKTNFTEKNVKKQVYMEFNKYINDCIIKCYLEEEKYLRSMILRYTKGASLEIAQDFFMRYFQRRPYIEGNVVIVEYNPIDQTMLIEKGEWLENDEITIARQSSMS